MKNLTTPIAILLVAVVIGASLIIVQNNKSNSIELQKQEEAKLAMLKLKQEECAGTLKGLQNKWGNIIGVKYSEFWEECEVTYYDTTEDDLVKTSPISLMVTVK